MEDSLGHQGSSPSQATRSSPPPRRLACTSCRKRKAKCDLSEPPCSNCTKHHEECVYPTRKRKMKERMKYRDVVERLEQMERLVSDFGSLSPGSPLLQLTARSSSRPDNTTLPTNQTIPLVYAENEPLQSTSQPSKRLPPQPPSGVIQGQVSGSSSIFSSQGISWVNSLIGDKSFGDMVLSLRKEKSPGLGLMQSMRYPLPSQEVLTLCVNEYSNSLNNAIQLFQQHRLANLVQRYLSGSEDFGNGDFAALNIVLVHSLRKLRGLQNFEEYGKYLSNTLSTLPSILVESTDMVGVGALLSMALYFVFVTENQAAVSILASAVQLMVLSGYHDQTYQPARTSADKLHQHRLLWQAYVIQSDLSLRLCIPPLLSADIDLGLPEELPMDGSGIILFEDGSILNFPREQVMLARLQAATYSRLYSPKSKDMSNHQLYECIDELESDLQAWIGGIPELVRPPANIDDSHYTRLMSLTCLHYTYFQLTVAIHSVVFQKLAGNNTRGHETRIMSSVALCVGAARATITLLDYHDNCHPYTIYLLNHVAWSVDILFINILQNKNSASARGDLKLLEKIVRHFEKNDPNHTSALAYQITSRLFQIALKAVQSASADSARQHVVDPCPENLAYGVATDCERVSEFPSSQFGHPLRTTPHRAADPPIDPQVLGNTSLGGNSEDLIFLDLEWRMPLVFEPEYWQDPQRLFGP